jgi:hypothetical protein
VIRIDPSMPGYRDLLLLAAAWNIGPAEVIARLVDHYYLTHSGTHTADGQAEDPADNGIAIHAVYRGQRIDALFHRPTSSVRILTAPLTNQVFRTPSGARAAVVTALNPGVSPNGSGWDFWIVTATGKTLHSLRFAR